MARVMKSKKTGKAKTAWGEIEAALSKLETKELHRAIKDLYGLSKENKTFLEARFLSPGAGLSHFKAVIGEALYPDVMSRDPKIRLSVARKAITQYDKATKDGEGVIELMIHYVEMGTRCTLEYGDIDDQFYDSMESMYDRVVKKLLKAGPLLVERFLPRLRALCDATVNMGWGYHDTLCGIFEEAFPEA